MVKKIAPTATRAILRNFSRVMLSMLHLLFIKKPGPVLGSLVVWLTGAVFNGDGLRMNDRSSVFVDYSSKSVEQLKSELAAPRDLNFLLVSAKSQFGYGKNLLGPDREPYLTCHQDRHLRTLTQGSKTRKIVEI